MDVTQYNYDKFTRETVDPLDNFDTSPTLGATVEDFPLWHLDSSETSLHQILSQNTFTIVEFGSFT